MKIGKRTNMMQGRYCMIRDGALFIYKDSESRLPLKLIYLKGMYISSNVKVHTSSSRPDFYYFCIWHDDLEDSDQI